MSAKKKIAFVTPWPPQVTGVGEYAKDLVSGLARLNEFEITVFTGCQNPENVDGLTIVSCNNQEIPDLSHFDLIIHQMGNNPDHLINYISLEKFGGVVQLHDLVLHDFIRHIVYSYKQEKDDEFYNILERWYGPDVIDIQKSFASIGQALTSSSSVLKYPLFEEIVQMTDKIIVHSDFAKRKINATFPNLSVLKMPLLYNVSQNSKKKSESNFMIGSFGYGDRFKHTDKLTKAFAKLVSYLKQVNKPVPIFMLAGKGDFNNEKLLAEKLGVADYIKVISSPPLAEFDHLMQQVDLIIQLRYPTRGEASASVTKAMQLGIPVMVSDIGWYKELPEFVVKISNPPMVESIYEALKKIIDPSPSDISYKDRAKKSELYAESLNYACYVADYADWMKNHMKNSANNISPAQENDSSLPIKKIAKAHPASKVLLDLSWGLEGFSGIPQDSRLLLNTLTEVPDLQVSGLLYGRSKDMLRENIDNFSARDITEKTFNVATLLSRMINSDHPAYHPNKYYRFLQRLRNHQRFLKKRDFELAQIPQENFYDLIWRSVLSKTLAPEYYDKFKQQEFFVSNINLDSMSLHASYQRQIKLDTAKFDFVIFQDQRAIAVSDNTTKIIRYHDTIPLTDIDTHAASNGILHGLSMRLCKKDSYYVCNSEPTREALLKINPSLEHRSITIPYTIPAFYKKQCDSNRLQQIFESRSGIAKFRGPVDFDYILSVGTIEPRKNHHSLIKAFQKLQARRTKPIKLVMIGCVGWKSHEVIEEMKYLSEAGRLIHLQGLSYEELPYLYSHAQTFVFPSFNEGFGFPPMEAMLCECPVIVSDIKAHRWVMGDAAMYCNPYDIDSISTAMERMTSLPESNTTRLAYIDKGLDRVKLYAHDRVRDQWQDLFDTLIAERRSHG